MRMRMRTRLMRNTGVAVAAVRIVVEGLITRKVQLGSALLASEALAMPRGFAATKLLVLINGLSTATTLVSVGRSARGRIDHRTMNSVARASSLTVSSNAVVSNPCVVTANAVHNVLAVGAEKHLVLARVTVERVGAKILLAVVADEAVQMVMLLTHDLVKKTTAPLLAHRANEVVAHWKTGVSLFLRRSRL